MTQAILSILSMMGWLGIILAILVTVNISTKTVYNTWTKKEKFSWKKMFKGILKALIFYVAATATSIAFTMLPFINSMISDTFEIMLISNEVLETLSTTAILGIVVMTIVSRGRYALEGIKYLAAANTGEIDFEEQK